MPTAIRFPPELIQRIQKYYLHRFGQKLTEGEADLYLDSLGSLFLVVYRGRLKKQMPGLPGSQNRQTG